MTHSRQWTILAALALGHFVADSLAGSLFTLLPEIQNDFNLTLSAGATLLMFFQLGANGIQIATGHLRPNKTRPLFLYLGLAGCLFISGLFLLPADRNSFWPLTAMLFICGLGIGMTHPELLRALHTLDKISSAVGTSIFMAGGVGGFAFGGWIATGLVHRWGFESMSSFCAACVLVGLILLLMRIQMARDESQTESSTEAEKQQISFWPIYILAIVAGSASASLVWAIPQALHQAGFELTFGGFSVMLFCLASGVGGIVVSRRAARWGELKVCAWMMAAGVPFGLLYPVWINHRASVVLVALMGLLCYGAYPLMVSMARHSRGGNLGNRMGLIVGGTWLVAGFAPRLLAPVAHRMGLKFVLLIVPLGYLAAAVMCWYLWIKLKRVDDL